MTAHTGSAEPLATVSSAFATVIGSSPGETLTARVQLAMWRALRTLLQGLAAALPVAGLGGELISVGYWQALGYSVLAAVFTAIASFLQGVASALPDDPTQRPVP
jgi:hypothetical protein